MNKFWLNVSPIIFLLVAVLEYQVIVHWEMPILRILAFVSLVVGVIATVKRSWFWVSYSVAVISAAAMLDPWLRPILLVAGKVILWYGATSMLTLIMVSFLAPWEVRQSPIWFNAMVVVGVVAVCFIDLMPAYIVDMSGFGTGKVFLAMVLSLPQFAVGAYFLIKNERADHRYQKQCA